MKRALLAAVLAVTLMVGFAPSAQASRVRCFVPGTYKIVCYNYTPYRIHMRLTIHTVNGPYLRYFTIFGNHKTVYSPAPVNYVNWRWWF